MKYKDYKRLAKISLKARKKTTRSTVRGISFGLILLMPLLFIVIAFHLDLNKEVNRDASIRVFNLGYVKDISKDDDYIQFIKEEYSDQVYDIKGIENVIKYNQYIFSNRNNEWDNDLQTYVNKSPFKVTIGNKEFTLDYHLKNQTETMGENEVGIQVIDTNVEESIFMKADYQLTDNKPLFAGSEFSNSSAKEIMLSSSILNHYNLTKEDVIDKNITITYELSYPQKATTSKTSIAYTSLELYSGIPITILKDYKVVGIFDSKIYNSQVRLDTQKNYYQEMSNYETYFWLTRDSLFNATNQNYLPELVSITKDEGEYLHTEIGYYYNETPINLSKNARNNDKVFIPLGMGAYQESKGNNIIPLYNTLIAFETYSDANNAVSVINSIFEQGATGIDDPYISEDYAQNTFNNYRMFYNAFTYACIVLAIFGGVIFFATLLNLYNTIHYSVQSRKNYLGMIRAIGMRGIDVIKMYFIEIFQIFKRSYIWSAIFGGGICFGISFLFKMIMESDAAKVITINLSLNPIYIAVAFLALIIVNTIISVVFSLVACHSVSNKPVLEVLADNR